MKNKLELFVYDLVKTNPKLKNLIRDIYQYLLAIVPIKQIKSDYEVKAREGFFLVFMINVHGLLMENIY